jgi:Tfp pilus assembly protein PilN
MIRLGIDFITPRTAIGRLGAAVLVGGAVLMGASMYENFAVQRAIADVKEELGAAAAKAKRGHRQALPDNDQLRARIQLANMVVQKRSIPWDALFRDIEAASGKDVAVLSVQPDAGAGVVRISGEARDAIALGGYIERLAKQPSFADVFLAQHEIRQAAGRSPIRFNVQATWVTAR